MNEKDPKDFEFVRETTVSVAERQKGQDVFAVCLKTDDENLLVPMKIYKIGLRGKNARVIDEYGEAAIYPLDFFMILPLAADAAAKIEEHRLNISKFAEISLV